MNRRKTFYWVSTGLLCLMMLGSVTMYFVNTEDVMAEFEILGHPSYLVYPLAVAKLLGILAILTKKSETLKEWAYAGFLFNFLLALSAHLAVGDGEFLGALVALILWSISYYYDKRYYSSKELGMGDY